MRLWQTVIERVLSHFDTNRRSTVLYHDLELLSRIIKRLVLFESRLVTVSVSVISIKKRGFRIIRVGAGAHNVHNSELGTDEMIELSEKYSQVSQHASFRAWFKRQRQEW